MTEEKFAPTVTVSVQEDGQIKVDSNISPTQLVMLLSQGISLVMQEAFIGNKPEEVTEAPQE